MRVVSLKTKVKLSPILVTFEEDFWFSYKENGVIGGISNVNLFSPKSEGKMPQERVWGYPRTRRRVACTMSAP